MNQKNKSLLFLILLIPSFLFSQIRVKENMELRILEEGEVRVTGSVGLLNATSLISLDGNMSISGNLTNSAAASNFVIESDANNTGSLIVDGDINGNYRVERYITGNTWHFLSASVENLTTNAFYFNESPLTWIATYNEPAGTWDFIPGTNEPLPFGIGYKFWVKDSKAPITAYMQGAMRSTTLPVNLSYGGVGGGWNLIGNPFPSAIDWDDENWGTNTTGSVYVWDSTYNDGDYRVYNGSAGDLTNGIIPISQSFFVRATSEGSFNIPSSARTHEEFNFYKSTNKSESPYVKLQLNHQDKGNSLFIGFPENGTPHFDYKGDAHKLYSAADVPQLFAMEDGEKLCINANRPLNEEKVTIPLYIDQVENGEYSLTLSQGENLPGVQIILNDLKNGSQQDLKKFPTYQYIASDIDAQQRFLISFEQNAYGFEDLDQEASLIQIYGSDQTVFIASYGIAESQKGQIEIYNTQGQLLFEGAIEGKELVRVPVTKQHACLIVKVKKNVETKSEKIILL